MTDSYTAIAENIRKSIRNIKIAAFFIVVATLINFAVYMGWIG